MTLSAADKLRDAGLADVQARAIVDSIRDTQATGIEPLSTTEVNSSIDSITPSMTGRLMSCRLRPRVRHGPAAPHLPSPPAHPVLPCSLRCRLRIASARPRNVRARTDNEPDNDHTNTPLTTQIGRLYYLSFAGVARVAKPDPGGSCPRVQRQSGADRGDRGRSKHRVGSHLAQAGRCSRPRGR